MIQVQVLLLVGNFAHPGHKHIFQTEAIPEPFNPLGHAVGIPIEAIASAQFKIQAKVVAERTHPRIAGYNTAALRTPSYRSACLHLVAEIWHIFIRELRGGRKINNQETMKQVKKRKTKYKV